MIYFYDEEISMAHGFLCLTALLWNHEEHVSDTHLRDLANEENQ